MPFIKMYYDGYDYTSSDAAAVIAIAVYRVTVTDG